MKPIDDTLFTFSQTSTFEDLKTVGQAQSMKTTEP